MLMCDTYAWGVVSALRQGVLHAAGRVTRHHPSGIDILTVTLGRTATPAYNISVIGSRGSAGTTEAVAIRFGTGWVAWL